MEDLLNRAIYDADDEKYDVFEIQEHLSEEENAIYEILSADCIKEDGYRVFQVKDT